jgi:3-oxoadipate enol-lactonase
LVETPPEVYAACCEALAAWDFRDQLTTIKAPTLVIAAAGDQAAPPEDAELIARGIGAPKVVLPDAAHLANVEQPEAFSALVAQHLAPVEVA